MMDRELTPDEERMEQTYIRISEEGFNPGQSSWTPDLVAVRDEEKPLRSAGEVYDIYS